MDIGHRMKELRIQYGLTQQELADRSELSKGFISQLERNLTSPSVGTLLDIIQCLGTTPAEFFTDQEPEQLVFRQEDYFIKEKEELHHQVKWLLITVLLEAWGSGNPEYHRLPVAAIFNRMLFFSLKVKGFSLLYRKRAGTIV